MNRSVFLEADLERCYSRAEELFLAESGLGKDGERYERMRREAFRIREEISPGIDIRAVCSFYEDFRLDGQLLVVEGQEFKCPAFQQVEPEAVEGVWFYALSAGDFSIDAASAMDQLYADMWGTAFTDAAREEVMAAVEEVGRVSDSFGPGFYGMELADISKIIDFVDFAAIGLELGDNRLLRPVKSCTGILFKVNERYAHLVNACEFCSGSRLTCSLCSIKAGRI